MVDKLSVTFILNEIKIFVQFTFQNWIYGAVSVQFYLSVRDSSFIRSWEIS